MGDLAEEYLEKHATIHFKQDHAREALETHGQSLLAAAGLKPSAEVIPLREPDSSSVRNSDFDRIGSSS